MNPSFPIRLEVNGMLNAGTCFYVIICNLLSDKDGKLWWTACIKHFCMPNLWKYFVRYSLAKLPNRNWILDAKQLSYDTEPSNQVWSVLYSLHQQVHLLSTSVNLFLCIGKAGFTWVYFMGCLILFIPLTMTGILPSFWIRMKELNQT